MKPVYKIIFRRVQGIKSIFCFDPYEKDFNKMIEKSCLIKQ